MTRKAKILAVMVGLALATALLMWVLTPRDPMEAYYSRLPNPPPVVVNVGTNKGSTRVFPSNMGCFITLPDRTLWRWGQPGGYQFSRTNAPEQVTTNNNWIGAFAGSGNCVAVSADGGLWTWGIDFGVVISSTPSGNWIPAPTRIGIEQSWVSATSGGDHTIAIRQDGTLWGRGHDSEGQLGYTLGSNETNFEHLGSYKIPHVRTNWVQIGTNDSWTAVAAEGSCTLALRDDGSLWVWGRIEQLLNGNPGRVFSTPTQVSRQTNWLAVQWIGTQVFAVNRNGELWRLFDALPQPSADIQAVGKLFASGCVPGRFAMAVGFCQLHADGTLWTTGLDVSQAPDYKLLNQWHRVGDRSDWVSLWSGSGTGYGMTADGTLWTWGTHWGQEGVTTFSSKVHILENRIRAWFGAPPGAYSINGFIPIQKEPRPLMKIIAGEASL